MIGIGGGVLSTFHVDTSTAQWIGYQIILGAGIGSAMPMVRTYLKKKKPPPAVDTYSISHQSLISIMAVLPQSEIPIGNGVVVFSQFLGGAIFLAIAESLFTSHLLSGISANAPGVDAEAIINAGAEAVRTVVDAANLPAVIQAYNVAITTTYVSFRLLSRACCLGSDFYVVRCSGGRSSSFYSCLWDALGQC